VLWQNYPFYKDENTIAMRKGFDGEQTITVLSNKGSGGDAYELSLEGTGFAAGVELTEVVTCESVTVEEGGKVGVAMKGGEPRILYPSSLVGKLC
jgi:alpha-amylase